MNKIETEEQLIELWKSYGIHNLNDYFERGDVIRYNHKVNYLLSPFNIRGDVFWGASRKHFSNDCVAGYRQPDKSVKNLDDIKAANEQNFSVSKCFGTFWLLQNALFIMNPNLKRKEKPNLLEIGTGFGCLPELGLPQLSKEFNYFGYDVYPDYPNVEKIDNYVFSDEQIENLKEKSIDIIYSCNVFQHIDKWHQFIYIDQMAKILPKGRPAIIMFAVNGETNMYGQRIILPSERELMNRLDTDFKVIQTFRNNISENGIDTRTFMLERR